MVLTDLRYDQTKQTERYRPDHAATHFKTMTCPVSRTQTNSFISTRMCRHLFLLNNSGDLRTNPDTWRYCIFNESVNNVFVCNVVQTDTRSGSLQHGFHCYTKSQINPFFQSSAMLRDVHVRNRCFEIYIINIFTPKFPEDLNNTQSRISCDSVVVFFLLRVRKS